MIIIIERSDKNDTTWAIKFRNFKIEWDCAVEVYFKSKHPIKQTEARREIIGDDILGMRDLRQLARKSTLDRWIDLHDIWNLHGESRHGCCLHLPFFIFNQSFSKKKSNYHK